VADFSPLWAGDSGAPLPSGTATEITRGFMAAWHKG